MCLQVPKMVAAYRVFTLLNQNDARIRHKSQHNTTALGDTDDDYSLNGVQTPPSASTNKVLLCVRLLECLLNELSEVSKASTRRPPLTLSSLSDKHTESSSDYHTIFGACMPKTLARRILDGNYQSPQMIFGDVLRRVCQSYEDTDLLLLLARTIAQNGLMLFPHFTLFDRRRQCHSVNWTGEILIRVATIEDNDRIGVLRNLTTLV